MKKFTSFLLSAVMVLSLAACSSNATQEVQEEVDKTSNSIAGSLGLDSNINFKQDTEKKDDSSSTKISKEVREVLDSLETDYSKVKWGVEYSFAQDIPGLVASVSMYNDGYSNWLVVALTNAYNIGIEFNGKMTALDKQGNEIGSTFVYEPCIGSANTVAYRIYCGSDMPDGRVRWTDCEVYEASENKEYIPWEMDYSVNQKDGAIVIDYTVGATNKDLPSANFSFLLLDKDGFILDFVDDFADSAKKNSTYKGSVNSYLSDDLVPELKALAVFGNPVK